MDTGTMFLLGVICVTVVVTLILGRKHGQDMETEERQRLERELLRERVRLAGLAAHRTERERQARELEEELVRATSRRSVKGNDIG